MKSDNRPALRANDAPLGNWLGAVELPHHGLFADLPSEKTTTHFQSGLALHVTTEFGAGLAPTTGAIAVFLWLRRGELRVVLQFEASAAGSGA